MSNTFGKRFRITSWGESHGKAMGVVIDGCPSNIPITEEEINRELFYRAPGRSAYTSPRKEQDRVIIYSGVYQNKTTGAPISLIIPNQNYDSSPYKETKRLYKPGHAQFTYLEKYGIYDPDGGGRASARETVARVAAGAVAKKILSTHNIQVLAYLSQIGDIAAREGAWTQQQILQSPLFCPDKRAQERIIDLLNTLQDDSIGGVVQCYIRDLPPGLGDPVFEKLQANLAKAMLSIPAAKGFAIGKGFAAAHMRGSEHNDTFALCDGKIVPSSNHAGGTLGGISTGQPITFQVPFKPTSSIGRAQPTLDKEGNAATFQLPKNSKHDPCVAIRAVPVVAAMASLVITDALLSHAAYASTAQHLK